MGVLRGLTSGDGIVRGLIARSECAAVAPRERAVVTSGASLVARRAVMLALLLIVGLAATGRAQVWTEWHNALQPSSPGGPELTLVENGAGLYRIVTPASPLTTDTKAAQELQFWIQQMTGVQLAIIAEGHPLGGKKPVSIGRTQMLQQSGLPEAGVDLREEGYGIAVQGDTLFLWGGSTRGSINAVMALLEEDLGCRWYTATHNRVPQGSALRFTAAPRTYVPPTWLRDPFYHVAFSENWSLRNRTNAPWAPVRRDWGGYVDYDGLFVHTFHTLMPPSQYFDAHPEYYMMNASGVRVKTQLCCTHQDVRQIVTQKILATLAANPNTEIVEISQMDSQAICLCPNCRAIDEPEGTGMGSMLHLVNYVAEQIEPVYPDVLIGTLAYFSTLHPPLTVRPRHNVVVRLCNTASWNYPVTPMAQSDFGPLLENWGAIHDKLSVWDYTVNYWHYLAPFPNMDVIAADISYMVAHNVVGIMTQGGYQSTSERDTLRSWVIAKLLWDPSRDWHELQQDFIWGHFGDAAAKVAEYNELLYNQGVLHASSLRKPPMGIRFDMNQPFLSAEFLAAAEAIFDQAEAAAENQTVRERVERERLPILYVRLEQGPDLIGPVYGPLIDRFETIARREGATRTREGDLNLDGKLAEYRAAYQDYMYLYHYKAIEPAPPDQTSQVGLRAVPLSWTSRQPPSSYRIYLGTADPPSLVADQADSTYIAPPLDSTTTYYWRVDSVHSEGLVTGDTWTFTTARSFGDFDRDGDVDLNDFSRFQICLTGRDVPQGDPDCRDARLDADGDVDAQDLTLFQRCLSGSHNLADPNCAK